jgi:hypothetical protein
VPLITSKREYAARYEEFREKLQAVNRLLRESGSEIDNKQEFVVLDEEAFQNCERDGESSSCLSELSVADEIITTAPGLPAPTVNVERPAASAKIVAQSSPPPMIVEDQPNTQRQVTLDDLRRQQALKPKRLSSSPTSADQMTLW